MNNLTPPLNGPELAASFADVHPPFQPREALAEANRCLYCFDAPCTAACPTHIDVPRFIRKIASGNLKGSALTILEANVLGLSCSRVCPVEVLCEGACVMHRYNRQPIEIGRLQRYAMERGNVRPKAAAAPRAGRVACIGGGPASLACAAELRRMGYAATVIDARERAGGLNTYGVAEYKLRAADSEKEIEMIRGLGVEFRLGVEVGVAPSVDELEREFELIFIGAGLGPTQPLGIPGETLPGVVDALRFIADYKTRPGVRVGRRVAVVGGGNTAIDAAVAARRLGAQEVHLVYRRTEFEMPAFRFEVERARQEGVRFHFLTQPVAVEGHGSVELLECARVELGDPDRSGRKEPRVMEGPHFWIECDMVIPSIGQSRLVELLRQCRGIEVESGMVKVAEGTGETANPRYYAGGDCVNGGREVVDAVAEGKRAARAMGLRLERLHG